MARGRWWWVNRAVFAVTAAGALILGGAVWARTGRPLLGAGAAVGGFLYVELMLRLVAVVVAVPMVALEGRRRAKEWQPGPGWRR